MRRRLRGLGLLLALGLGACVLPGYVRKSPELVIEFGPASRLEPGTELVLANAWRPGCGEVFRRSHVSESLRVHFPAARAVRLPRFFLMMSDSLYRWKACDPEGRVVWHGFSFGHVPARAHVDCSRTERGKVCQQELTAPVS